MSPEPSRLRALVARLYVPLTTAVLVLGVGNWWAASATVDVDTVAQNARLTFQAGGDATRAAALAGITPDDAALAEGAMQVDRTLDGARPILLYVGNSQSLGIMDRVEGDLTSPQWLQIRLAGHAAPEPRWDVRVASMPNLTASELVLKLADALEATPRQVDVLLVGAVLEELRGLGVRDALAPLAARPAVRATLAALVHAHPDLPAAARALAPSLARTSTETHGRGRAATGAPNEDESAAHLIDAAVDDALDAMPLFRARTDLQGLVGSWWHGARNAVFGITSASVRPVPDEAYRASLELFELALRLARARGIEVALYLAPLRPITPNPNDPRDVARFRRDLPALAARYGATLIDTTDLVPEALWTNYPDDALGTSGQRDFAHFTGAAHRLLGDTLARELRAPLTTWAEAWRARRGAR